MKVWQLLSGAAFGLLLTAGGCSDSKKTDSTGKPYKTPGSHGELALVSLAPQETFQSVQTAMLAGDLDGVYKFYSMSFRMVQDRAGLEEVYRANGKQLKQRFQGAEIIPASMQYPSETRAVCRVRWGTGDVTAYEFVMEKDGWKLNREYVAVRRDNDGGAKR